MQIKIVQYCITYRNGQNQNHLMVSKINGSELWERLEATETLSISGRNTNWEKHLGS
jgi:hypothetical protein